MNQHLPFPTRRQGMVVKCPVNRWEQLPSLADGGGGGLAFEYKTFKKQQRRTSHSLPFSDNEMGSLPWLLRIQTALWKHYWQAHLWPLGGEQPSFSPCPHFKKQANGCVATVALQISQPTQLMLTSASSALNFCKRGHLPQHRGPGVYQRIQKGLQERMTFSDWNDVAEKSKRGLKKNTGRKFRLQSFLQVATLADKVYQKLSWYFRPSGHEKKKKQSLPF